MNILRLIFATLLIAATSALAQADDIDAIDRLSPSQFESFADDLVAALSYKSSSSAEPLGVLGFDLGLGVSLVRLALETRSVELVVSKGLFAFTPYAGIGRVWGDVTPNSTAAATLQTLSPTLDRIFAGLQFGLVIGSLSIEVDKTGDALGASTKLGLRF